MSEPQILLTGIKPTGDIHIGNYLAVIKPAIERSEEPSVKAAYFVANSHGLNQIQDAAELKRITFNVAAAWLACGLDPDKVTLYVQSEVPQTFELATILTSFTPKGWMNKMHAYKAAVDKNNAAGNDTDAGINMGLYTYPILMAADILQFDADGVPVGKDQVQHVEIARDMAQRFNHHYKKEAFKLPNVIIKKEVATVPGLDGRKMSKSYNNVIPLFLEPKKLRKLIMKIKTDSKLPGEPKNAEEASVYTIYKSFMSEEKANAFKAQLEEGLAWGDAKQLVYADMHDAIGDLYEKHKAIQAKPNEVYGILAAGKDEARARAAEVLRRVKDAAGLL